MELWGAGLKKNNLLEHGPVKKCFQLIIGGICPVGCLQWYTDSKKMCYTNTFKTELITHLKIFLLKIHVNFICCYMYARRRCETCTNVNRFKVIHLKPFCFTI